MHTNTQDSDQGGIKFELRGIGHELHDRLLVVPFFQRSYAWSGEQIAEFWADIKAAFSANSPEYFLGTIVLTRQGHEGGRFTIIDGQQRLATATILLAAIRDEYSSRGDDSRAGIIQSKYLSTSDLETATEVSRLCLNSEDLNYFDRRIINKKTEATSKASHVAIAAAYDFLSKAVNATAKDAGGAWASRLTGLTMYLKDRVKCIVLEVPTDTDAFLIFETLNDRGADLTIADLLKNYLFGRAGSTKLNAVRDAWMQVLGGLEINAENVLFTTFLRHYWSSRQGAIRERELYKSIKDHVTTSPQVVEFTTSLQSASVLYAALLHSDHEFWESYGTSSRANVATLLRLDLEQNRPLLLAALQHFQKKEIQKLLPAIVCWSVRGIIVGGIGGGTAEKTYCGAAVKIRNGDIKTTADLLQEMDAFVPSDAQFTEAFATAKISKASLARYLLLALERGAKNEPEPQFLPNANEEEVNLEHILPKRAGTDWAAQFTPDERVAFVHRLGNLALLQKSPNGKIGNKPFSEKIPILKQSAFSFTKKAGATTKWTTTAIEKRQTSMAELAPKVWPR